MSAYLSPLGNEVQTDANGAPLNGGQIWTYAAGTSTPATTYTGEDAGTPQANPVELNASGLPDSPIWLEGGTAYKLVVKDADGVTLRTVDNISGINDPINAGTASEWVIYTGAPTYINATSFSLEGDQTSVFQANRRMRSTNTGGVVHSTISESSYEVGTGLTTVTVTNDGGTLDAGLSAVAYGLISVTSTSVPRPLLNVRRITATGTYTPTAGTRAVLVELVGGGGAGGGVAATAAAQYNCGSGGAAGGYASSFLTSGFSGVTVTIGAAGAGASGANGGAGGATSFGALLSATGGAGGSTGGAVPVAAFSDIQTTTPATGGVGAGGNVDNSNGEPGGVGIYFTRPMGGQGGASRFGGGAAGRANSANAGFAATSPGAGGGGCATSPSSGAYAGGNGAAGLCIVYEYS